MGEITVRKASYDDLDVLKVFEQALIAAERPFDPTIKPDPVHYYDLEAMLKNPDLLLLLAEIDGQVAGSGYCRIDPDKPFLQHVKKAYFGFMFVVPEHRGNGINGLVMTQLMDWARERGITECRLDVYSGNYDAMRAYQKLGFRPYSLEMRMDLREED